MAIEVGPVIRDLGVVVMPAVSAVGLACLLVVLSIKAFKTIRMALGYSPLREDVEEADRAWAQAVAFDSGYSRARFDSSWSAEEKTAWREGVSARMKAKSRD